MRKLFWRTRHVKPKRRKDAIQFLIGNLLTFWNSETLNYFLFATTIAAALPTAVTDAIIASSSPGNENWLQSLVLMDQPDYILRLKSILLQGQNKLFFFL